MKIILDTDFAGDSDDIVALQSACVMHKIGQIELLGVLVNSSGAKTPGAAATFIQNWNIPTIVGCVKGSGMYDPGSVGGYTTGLYDNFPHAGYGLNTGVTDATTVYRTLLANASQPVDVISVGFLANLGNFLASTGDGISPLNGAQLATQKIRKLWIMGGDFQTTSPEYNVGLNSQVRSGTTAFFRNLPLGLPCYWTDFNLGVTFTVGTPLSSLNTGDPARSGWYLASIGQPNIIANGRSAWDPLAVHTALTDGANMSWTRGNVVWDSGVGSTVFQNNLTGQHYRGDKKLVDSFYSGTINQIISTISTGTINFSWGSAAAIIHCKW